ncbi:DUF692 family multinuclear iron-containing protein [Calidithermus chliarophilus]|uniref:multinuclear nonheme iron-dependent oxidase n=1 Tax=Calidithermus chliarophilus TaxID=52023 RepID=UPI0004112137|nr:DUF692 family multinuclear iron-containing protein [Calidithermus chliarophilus]
MIRLAANGTPELFELLYTHDLPLDYIKCPLSPDSRREVLRARHYLPVLLHGWGPPGYSLTMPEIPEPGLLCELAGLSGTPFVSAHLDYLPGRDGELSPEALLGRVASSASRLRALTGKEVLLENLPWYAWKSRPRYTTDPAFIAQALECSGSDLLLDLAHARVAAWNRGEEVRDYLAALPLGRVREVHVSGPRLEPEGLRDRHRSLSEEDYRLLEWVMPRLPRLEVLTLEYMGSRPGGEAGGPEVWLEQIERLERVREAQMRAA